MTVYFDEVWFDSQWFTTLSGPVPGPVVARKAPQIPRISFKTIHALKGTLVQNIDITEPVSGILVEQRRIPVAGSVFHAYQLDQHAIGMVSKDIELLQRCLGESRAHLNITIPTDGSVYHAFKDQSNVKAIVQRKLEVTDKLSGVGKTLIYDVLDLLDL